MAVMFDSVGAPYKVKYAARIIFKAIIDLKHRPTDWLFEVTKQSVAIQNATMEAKIFFIGSDPTGSLHLIFSLRRVRQTA